jgi:hypothetical protein
VKVFWINELSETRNDGAVGCAEKHGKSPDFLVKIWAADAGDSSQQNVIKKYANTTCA